MVFYAQSASTVTLGRSARKNKQEGEGGLGGGGEQTTCKVSELGYNDTMSDTEAIILGSIFNNTPV